MERSLTLTWACLLGSSRSKHPTWCDCVWMMPAHTMLSGFGSMPSSSCMPNPESLFLAPGRSRGIWALNTFWARCFSLQKKIKIDKEFKKFWIWNLPAEIFPPSEERFGIHFCRLEELVDRQRQFDDEVLWCSVVAERECERWRI